MTKVRLNLANSQELLEIPGIDSDSALRIVRFRTEHGPIRDAGELSSVVGHERVTASMLGHVDFAPADVTAPEAPGA